MTTRFPPRTLAALVGPVLAGIALLAAAASPTLTPRGPLGDPLVFAGALLCTAAAALHRPLGGASLGLGAAVLAPAIVLLGPLPTALLAGASLIAAESARRLEVRWSAAPQRERRHWWRLVETAAESALAALAAGAAWTLAAPRGALSAGDSRLYDAVAAGAAAYLVVLVGLRLLSQRQHRPARRSDALVVLRPLGIDLAAWCAGVAVAVVASRLGAGLAGALLAGFALLSLEARRNARRSARSRRRVSDLEELSRAGQRVVAGGGELASVVAGIHRECRRLLPVAWFHLELAADTGEGRSWFAGPGGPLARGRPRPEAFPPALPGIHRRSGWKVLDYPLESDERALARLRLWCDPRELERGDLPLFETLLPQLAASLHRVLLDREAKRDPLTGLAVRRVLERRLGEAYADCMETGSAMAVVMCDLDHFKSINDTHGHTAGDRALIAVARLLQSGTRERDLCCRYGGEEFILLLREADGVTALGLAERLRREVEALHLVIEGERVPLTLSAGVAAFPELYVPRPEELPLLADAALYEAKDRGRNLCLLHLGLGRFRTVAGEEVTNEALPPPPPPRLFA